MNKIKFIMFDLDGTLINSISDLHFAVSHAVVDLGYAPVTEKQVSTWVGNGVPTLMARALSRNINVRPDLDARLKQQSLKYFNHYYTESNHQRTTVFPGVLHSLEALEHQGIKLAIISNKPSQFIPPIIEKLGLSSFFDDIIGGDQVRNPKPHAEPLIKLMERNHFLPEECLMVGDSRNDIVAGQNAGCPTLGYTFGYNYGVPISDSKPTYVCDKFDGIIELVKGYPQNLMRGHGA